ncbi:telomere repeat-binding protein 5-like isoform X2 [Amaranthus tricolor]|uniref:telomere repeat-binding protein 5-like isoform X2 n=1 Tax=Amaranthus tricolor TaxID=29722 RepID=UPI00258434AC|nr:telomere repeat-binding protein 5-like isoform X2 [Amaranthus tricolor]
MLQKRLYNGFSGYQMPFVPRAARSARRRGPRQAKFVDNQLCAFDLLATVAGKLLEGESSKNTATSKDQLVDAGDAVMLEQDEGNLSLNADCRDMGSAEAASLNPELELQAQNQKCNVNEIVDTHNDASSPPASEITLSHCLEKDDNFVKMDINDENSEFFSPPQISELCVSGHIDPNIVNVVGVDTHNDPNIDSMELEDGKKEISSWNVPDLHCSKDPDVNIRKAPPAVGVDYSIKQSLGVDHFSCGSISPCSNSIVNVVARDDDEKSFKCTQPSTKAARLPVYIGNRKIRRLLGSKYRKVASKVKCGDYSETELRCIYRSRRTGYKRPRSRRIYAFKKRKLYQYSSLSNSDGHTGSKVVYDSPGTDIDQSVSAFSTVRHGVDGSSFCVAGQSTTFASQESHVKLKIRSFKMPELFIEMPETATIGSLKRTVMDAVTALLGGGLRVGVLLKGKKIRDDSRTLVQSGICCHDEVKSLGFALEPNPSNICFEDNSHTVSIDVPQPVLRSARTDNDQGASHEHVLGNIGHLVESDHDSAPLPAETTADKAAVDSRALVALPDGTPQPLAAVLAAQKSKRSDTAQRRIRRPFSVSEVEALVQAVEELGTGRWRDVKLRAFDNVNYRTYVDLKDKWKTLVHTAKISPQQRRGEPVPQELLDRVLSAHSYWSEQQQLKQPSDTCLL